MPEDPSYPLNDLSFGEPVPEKGIDVGEISEAIRTSLESLQRKWEGVPERDEAFLFEAEMLLMRRHDDKSAAEESTPEAIVEYFSRRRKDLHELDSSRHGGSMSILSGDSVGECRYVFLDKILSSAFPKEVSACGVALLERVSDMINDAYYNRDEVQKIRNAVAKKSYNMFGYDSQGTTETLDDLSVEEKGMDDEFLRGFQNTAHGVKEAVNTLVSTRLRQLQKPE